MKTKFIHGIAGVAIGTAALGGAFAATSVAATTASASTLHYKYFRSLQECKAAAAGAYDRGEIITKSCYLPIFAELYVYEYNTGRGVGTVPKH